MIGTDGAGRRWSWHARAGGAAPVEVALLLPVLMLLLLGVLAAARVTEPLLGVTAVAREAARAGALADNADDADRAARARGEQVVRVTASTSVRLSDVPLLHASDLRLQRTHAEVVGLWRAVAGQGS
jgi:Flp pilus assembly protein TadG